MNPVAIAFSVVVLVAVVIAVHRLLTVRAERRFAIRYAAMDPWERRTYWHDGKVFDE